jgi:para-nitrobenzyl esterase
MKDMVAHQLRKHGRGRQLAVLMGYGALVAGLFLIAPLTSFAQRSAGPLVTVTGGKLRGQLLPAPGGAAFRGIPYAAAPTGDLRWRETQPVKPWKGVRQADKNGPSCSEGAPAADSASSSEDCLFLNVWTPEWPTSVKRPVMLWIHGGGRQTNLGAGGGNGASVEPPYDGASLARHGVVVVTISFRTGPFALMGHPELTAESPHHASGAYAVFDQIAGLKWIHDNIARFGGDPGSVTLFSQSGGARYTSLLLTSPLAKGLIHRAIMDSGSSQEAFSGYRNIMTPDQLEQLGVILANALKAPPTGAIKYLRGLPASEILAAMPEVFRQAPSFALPGALSFDYGMDGYAIPRSPREVYRNSKELPVPIIIGANSMDSGGPGPEPNSSPDAIQAWAKDRIETFYGKYPDLVERALKAYGFRGSPNDVSTYAPYGTFQNQLLIDLGHRCGSAITAEWHSTIAPSWHFEFSRVTPGHRPVHGGELRFIFGYLADESSDETARKLSSDMQQYWTNFAKTSDPNGPGLPVWPKYTAATKVSLEFTNNGPVQVPAFRMGPCDIYREKFARDYSPSSK